MIQYLKIFAKDCPINSKLFTSLLFCCFLRVLRDKLTLIQFSDMPVQSMLPSSNSENKVYIDWALRGFIFIVVTILIRCICQRWKNCEVHIGNSAAPGKYLKHHYPLFRKVSLTDVPMRKPR